MATVCATEIQELKDEQIVRFENLECMERKYPIDPFYMDSYHTPGIEGRDAIVIAMINAMVSINYESVEIYHATKDGHIADLHGQILLVYPSIIMHAVTLFNRVFSVDKELVYSTETFIDIAYGCMAMAIKMGTGVEVSSNQLALNMISQHSLTPSGSPIEIEKEIIDILAFDLMPATPHDFLMELLFSYPYNGEFSAEMFNLAIRILYLTSIDEFLSYPSHVLAEAALLLADDRPEAVYRDSRTPDCMEQIVEVLTKNSDYKPIVSLCSKINARFLRLDRENARRSNALAFEPRESNEVPCIPQEQLLDGTVQDLGVIGEGAYGRVHKIKFFTEHGESIAICKISKIQGGIDFTVLREISILRMLRHPNIVRMLDIWTRDDGTFGFILEFVREDMHRFIENLVRKGRYLSMTNLRRIMYALLDGVSYLHDNDIIHRDIKPSNILIDYEAEINGPLTLKLADFGLARKITNVNMINLSPRVITLWYRPPEILLETHRYTPAVDVWSVGCVLLELVNRKAVFAQNDPIQMLNMIFRILGTNTISLETFRHTSNWNEYSKTMTVGPGYPMDDIIPIRRIQRTTESPIEFEESYNNLKDLACQMLTLDPRKRITAASALSHPFFQTMFED